jgi:hypothetical protein
MDDRISTHTNISITYSSYNGIPITYQLHTALQTKYIQITYDLLVDYIFDIPNADVVNLPLFFL